jgi:hypothetical protein
MIRDSAHTFFARRQHELVATQLVFEAITYNSYHLFTPKDSKHKQ